MANPKPFKPKSKTGSTLKKVDDIIEKKYPSAAKSSVYKDLKENVKSVASYLGYKKGGFIKTKKNGKVSSMAKKRR
jgi:hypothetical protein